VYSTPLGEVIPPGANAQLNLKERFLLSVSPGEDLGHTMELGEVQETARGEPPIRMVRTQVQIIGLPLGGRRQA
jgi:hypothetical protein